MGASYIYETPDHFSNNQQWGTIGAVDPHQRKGSTENWETQKHLGNIKVDDSMRTENTKSEYNNQPASDSDAKFLGWQETKSGDVVALYNITVPGHPSCGSTVSEKSLQQMNLQIPETPLSRTPPEKL